MLLKKAFQLPQWLLFRRGQAAVALVCLWLLAIALPGVHVSRRSAPLMRIATATHTAATVSHRCLLTRGWGAM